MRNLCQICSCKSHFFYINMMLLSQSDMYVIERIIEWWAGEDTSSNYIKGNKIFDKTHM